MTIHDRRELQAEARRILAQNPIEKRIVLLFAGASALLSLLAALATYLLDMGIAGTGGLSGMQLRSVLSTAQQLLSALVTVALPFWTLGYIHTTLRMARGHRATESSLLEGFRRFGPGLRLMLLQNLLFTCLFMLCFYVVFLVLGMTPLAAPAFEIMEPLVEQYLSDPTWMPDDATYLALMEALLPILVCGLIAACAVLVPLSYRLRLTQLRIMDDPRCRARQAMADSFRATRGNCLALFRLDLRFWWFWLLEGLLTVIAFGDMLLPLVGVTLPLAPEVASLAFSILAMVLQLALYYGYQNQIRVTYALAYATLLDPQ